MSDKPYSPRTGGRYRRDPETGKRTRIDGREAAAAQAPNATTAKAEKSPAKPRKET